MRSIRLWRSIKGLFEPRYDFSDDVQLGYGSKSSAVRAVCGIVARQVESAVWLDGCEAFKYSNAGFVRVSGKDNIAWFDRSFGIDEYTIPGPQRGQHRVALYSYPISPTKDQLDPSSRSGKRDTIAHKNKREARSDRPPSFSVFYEAVYQATSLSLLAQNISWIFLIASINS